MMLIGYDTQLFLGGIERQVQPLAKFAGNMDIEIFKSCKNTIHLLPPAQLLKLRNLVRADVDRLVSKAFCR